MTATTYRSHYYRLTMERHYSVKSYHQGYSQRNFLSNISNTSRILNEPLPKTNELIIDSGCSDHMFNTNVQTTNYQVLHIGNKHVQVANGQAFQY